MAKISFLKYYKEQFKDVPKMWRLSKKHKKLAVWIAFIFSMLTLFNPFIIHIMWLYDTGRMKIDNRFMGEDKNNG